MKKLPIPFLLIIFSVVCFSCKKPIAFDYRNVKDLRIDNVGLNKSKISMNLVFYNPNSYGVNLRNVNCDLYIDSSYIGKCLLDTLMHIPKSSEFNLPVNMEVDMKNILKNAFSLLFNKEVTIGARGSTRVGKGGLFFTIPFNYEGKQKINFF